jgi:hypothetical protein
MAVAFQGRAAGRALQLGKGPASPIRQVPPPQNRRSLFTWYCLGAERTVLFRLDGPRRRRWQPVLVLPPKHGLDGFAAAPRYYHFPRPRA